MSTKLKRVIWPINPYESSEKLEKNMVQFLKQLNTLFPIEIQPVYVMTSAFSQIMGYLKDITYENVVRKAQSDATSYVKKFSDLNLLPVQLIENRVIFKSSEVKSFLDYLKSHPADFVCLTSYGKEKSRNLFVGSFAESYLRQSTKVTFVIGPEATGAGDITKALLPVEVTDESKEFVREILAQNTFSFLKKVKLFHKVTLQDYFHFNTDDLSFYGDKGLSKEEMSAIAKKVVLETFSEFNDQSNIEEMSCIITDTDASAGDALIEEAQASQSGLVIMRSKTGPFLEAFVGSITKEVISKSKGPVVVYPYNYNAKN